MRILIVGQETAATTIFLVKKCTTKTKTVVEAVKVAITPSF